MVLNYLYESPFIEYDYYNNYNLTILLAEHYCHLVNNPSMAFSFIISLLIRQKNKLKKLQKIILYELCEKYIYSILSQFKIDDENEESLKDINLLMNKQKFEYFQNYFIILRSSYYTKIMMNQYINNLIEAQDENTDTKNIIKLKDDKNPKPQISERIKHILMSKKSDANRAKLNITFTTKKDLKDYFNKELSEIKSKNKLKQYNFKNIKNYRLINSLSVKDNLRKHKLNRKLLLGRNFKKYQYNDDDEESLNKDKTKTAKKLNNYTYLELKDIKNIKRDTFITLHSIGGAYTDSRFDDMERSNSLTHMDFKFKEFKPYTALHPNKKFKRRGLANFRMNSERKISGIKIVGNTDSIEYQYDKFNLRSLKRDSLFGKSMKNIHLAKFKEKNRLKRDNSSISLDII